MQRSFTTASSGSFGRRCQLAPDGQCWLAGVGQWDVTCHSCCVRQLMWVLVVTAMGGPHDAFFRLMQPSLKSAMRPYFFICSLVRPSRSAAPQEGSPGFQAAPHDVLLEPSAPPLDDAKCALGRAAWCGGCEVEAEMMAFAYAMPYDQSLESRATHSTVLCRSHV